MQCLWMYLIKLPLDLWEGAGKVCWLKILNSVRLEEETQETCLYYISDGYSDALQAYL